MHPNELPVYEALDRMRIEYTRLSHPAAATMKQCESITGKSGAKHCKNLFLTNRSGTRFFLVMLRMDKSFRTAVVSRQLNAARLSFAAADQLRNILGLEQGSVSVAGLINDKEHIVHVAIDRDLLELRSILIHPNINTSSIELRVCDVLGFLKELNYTPDIIQV